MFRVVFLVGIALMVPLFFGLMFIASAYHKLVASRDRFKAAASQLATAESALAEIKARLAIAEEYPDLEANRAQSVPSDDLTSAESRAAVARQACQAALANYHTLRKGFPGNVIASIWHFEER